MPLDYICYISRSKVDQFHARLDPSGHDEVKETRSKTVEDKGALKGSLSSISAVLGGELSYGRRDVIQTERNLKKTYVDKLRGVLSHLQASDAIRSIQDVQTSVAGDSTFFSHVGEFSVVPALDCESPMSADKVITIVSPLQAGELALDCSLRNFSEGTTADGAFHVHSGNYAFFTGRIGLRLETVAILLAKKPGVVTATPLFLLLRFPSALSKPYDAPLIMI